MHGPKRNWIAVVLVALVGYFAAASSAEAQYPPPDRNLLCSSDLTALLDSGEGVVTATLIDLNTNQPVSGVVVNFEAEGATLNPASDTTDSNGVAETTFDPSGTGTVKITATFGDISCDVLVEVLGQQVASTQRVAEVRALPSVGSGGVAALPGDGVPLTWLLVIGVPLLAGILWRVRSTTS